MKNKNKLKIVGIIGLFIVLALVINFAFTIVGTKTSYNVGDVLNADFYNKLSGLEAYQCTYTITLNGNTIYNGAGDYCTFGECYILRDYKLSTAGNYVLRSNVKCLEVCDAAASSYSTKNGCNMLTTNSVDEVSFTVSQPPTTTTPTAIPEIITCYRCDGTNLLTVKATATSGCPAYYGPTQRTCEVASTTQVVTTSPPITPTDTSTTTQTTSTDCTYVAGTYCEGNNFIKATCEEREIFACTQNQLCADNGCENIEEVIELKWYQKFWAWIKDLFTT